jgi:hypothetical protein
MVKSKKESRNKPEIEYPLESRINAYGFLHFRKNLLAELGWTEGMAVTLEKNSDGSVTLRKVD